jgi:hypothetical protein
MIHIHTVRGFPQTLYTKAGMVPQIMPHAVSFPIHYALIIRRYIVCATDGIINQATYSFILKNIILNMFICGLFNATVRSLHYIISDKYVPVKWKRFEVLSS